MYQRFHFKQIWQRKILEVILWLLETNEQMHKAYDSEHLLTDFTEKYWDRSSDVRTEWSEMEMKCKKK